MQTNTLKSKTVHKKKTTVGRGGKRGKTSGRGTKGQSARAGNKKRPEMRDIIKKLPKLRGYRFKSFNVQPSPVTFEFIEKMYTAGETVSPETLVEKGFPTSSKNQLKLVKVLNKGTLSKSVSFVGVTFSAGARDTITKAGGTITEMPVKAKTQHKNTKEEKAAKKKMMAADAQKKTKAKKEDSVEANNA